MNTDAFTNPNGKIIKSTFQPKLLPPKISYDDELVGMIATAEAKIGELKGIAELWKNPHILIRRYLKEEAVVSSKIEGTLASIQDVFQYEVTGNTNIMHQYLMCFFYHLQRNTFIIITDVFQTSLKCTYIVDNFA